MDFIRESPLISACVVGGVVASAHFSKGRPALIALTIILLILFVFLMDFYRPGAVTEAQNSTHLLPEGAVLAPSYGTVKAIEQHNGNTHVLIYLSPMDVHVQYYPTDGRIVDQVHDMTGKFHLAFDMDKSDLNEKVITTIQPHTEKIPGNIQVQRIAGFLVRRITSAHEKLNTVKMAERMGMIKFGSRVDLILPGTPKLNIEVGQKMYGPNTLVCVY